MPSTARIAAVQEFIKAGNLLDGLKIKLSKVNVVLSDKTTLTDIGGVGQESDFDGYAASTAIVWGPDVFYNSVGQAVVVGDNKSFQSATGQTKPQTVYSWFATKAALTGPPVVPEQLILMTQFDQPIPINNNPDGLVIQPVFVFGQ
jgi:hypothetical protein